MMILGSSILAMGMCNIHAHSGVTEGGVLGLTLLLEHLFAISPALSALILTSCATHWAGGRSAADSC